MGRCVARAQTGLALFAMSYTVEEQAIPIQQRVAGDPGWFRSDRWDIDAKADHPVKEAELKQMLQAVLTHRYKLTFHREMRETFGYILVVDRKGPKLSLTSGEPRPGPMGHRHRQRVD